MKNSNQNSKKAFAISIFIHGAILFAIATITVQLVLPEGNVTMGTVEFSAVPQGAQLETPNVEPIAKPESPEMVKQRAAPAPPPAAKQAPTISEDAIKDVEVDDKGTMDVVEDKPEFPQHLPTKNEEPETTTKVDTQKAIEDVPPSKQPDEESPLPPPPVIGSGAEKTVQAGNDVADLKGQERVENQNYGTAQGVPSAELNLRAIPGNKKPSYPTMARLRNLEGSGIVYLTVNEKGQVTDVQVVQSAHSMLDEEVVRVMKTWKYQVPLIAGVYSQPFTFSLKGAAKEKPTLLRSK